MTDRQFIEVVPEGTVQYIFGKDVFSAPIIVLEPSYFDDAKKQIEAAKKPAFSLWWLLPILAIASVQR